MIFGVDLGTRRIALSCPALDFVAVHSVRDTGKHKVELEDAGRQLGEWAAAVIGHHYHWEEWVANPPEFYAEHPFAGFLPGGKRNIRTAIGQGITAGGVLALLPGTCHLIDQSQWKKELIGDGNASKDDIRAWLENSHPALAALCEQDQDAVDATCIALWAALAPASLL
jgi:hypothetical protein